MVRFSDIVKNGTTKEKESDKPKKSERQSKSFRFSNLEELKSSIDKEVAVPETRQDIEKTRKTCLTFHNYIKEVRARVVDNKPFEIEPALIMIGKIVDMPDMIKKIYQYAVHFSYEEDYLISHPANILACVLKIGQSMGYSKTELLELGLSALLYDVGMFVVPQDIIKKKGELNDSEVTLIRKHPETGKDILSMFKEEHPLLHRVAYEHHERENGQGYPRGLKGDEICEYAKITGMVDTYVAMISNRPHRKAMMQHTSVRELIWSKNLLFSSKIIKAFIKEISLYPVGSYVKLNNKTTGVVIDTNEENPMKPVVKLLFDGKGNVLTENSMVKLDETPLLYIVDSVSREEIPSKINPL